VFSRDEPTLKDRNVIRRSETGTLTLLKNGMIDDRNWPITEQYKAEISANQQPGISTEKTIFCCHCDFAFCQNRNKAETSSVNSSLPLLPALLQASAHAPLNSLLLS
jgi:hypothetical protein